MLAKKSLALLVAALIGLGACSASSDSTTAAAETSVASDDTTTTVAVATDSSVAAQAPISGGPGGGVSVESVASVDDLVALVQEAYGDASLDLHRGHQPVESTLIEVLGISHDEMHVRMETKSQNLEAIAVDLDIDPQTLIDALTESWSPAIDNLLADGSITEDEAEAYLAALEEAFTYRVTWNGSDATPTFAGI